MAHVNEQRPEDQGGLQKEGGYASPSRPITQADLPTVPAGPAQGAPSTPSTSTPSSDD
ncbi:hypothetical protein [Amycolatopsis australiensis]|uniref:Uncharacterized protein n=1 Tax=Amycolatopsis australiensis TaxID=546364 RepID=A0A1K1LM38_9PSEU|nr:hypothetical protein [Amycolatopsis australiensis]SFW11961.1 hypothetical protein SAMN04489730_0075 [Amycolatopsis australiensis]